MSHSSLLLSLLCICILSLGFLAPASEARNTDVEIRYVNYLLQEINSWLIHENEKRLSNFTSAINAATQNERSYLEARIGKENFEKFLTTYLEAKRGSQVREIQKNVFQNILSDIEGIFDFKYSTANNGVNAHHPAISCSVVKHYLSKHTENENSVFWLNPSESDHTFRQYCDLTNEGWGLIAKIGSKVPRDEVQFGDFNLNDAHLLSPSNGESEKDVYAQLRADRFATYGTNWILRLDVGNKQSVYFTPKDNTEECGFQNVKNICGSCACNTFVSNKGPVALKDIQFTDATQPLIPEDSKRSLNYYVYTAPGNLKE